MSQEKCFKYLNTVLDKIIWIKINILTCMMMIMPVYIFGPISLKYKDVISAQWYDFIFD